MINDSGIPSRVAPEQQRETAVRRAPPSGPSDRSACRRVVRRCAERQTERQRHPAAQLERLLGELERHRGDQSTRAEPHHETDASRFETRDTPSRARRRATGSTPRGPPRRLQTARRIVVARRRRRSVHSPPHAEAGHPEGLARGADAPPVRGSRPARAPRFGARLPRHDRRRARSSACRSCARRRSRCTCRTACSTSASPARTGSPRRAPTSRCSRRSPTRRPAPGTARRSCSPCRTSTRPNSAARDPRRHADLHRVRRAHEAATSPGSGSTSG